MVIAQGYYTCRKNPQICSMCSNSLFWWVIIATTVVESEVKCVTPIPTFPKFQTPHSGFPEFLTPAP